jgi:hypothetical protein
MPTVAGSATAAPLPCIPPALCSARVQGRVFIKRAGGGASPDETFAKVEVYTDDDVADLAARACDKFGWGAPTQARLFLASAGGNVAPTQPEIDAVLRDDGKRLGEGLPLVDAGVGSGAWLLARFTLPTAATGTS